MFHILASYTNIKPRLSIILTKTHIVQYHSCLKNGLKSGLHSTIINANSIKTKKSLTQLKNQAIFHVLRIETTFTGSQAKQTEVTNKRTNGPMAFSTPYVWKTRCEQTRIVKLIIGCPQFSNIQSAINTPNTYSDNQGSANSLNSVVHGKVARAVVP